VRALAFLQAPPPAENARHSAGHSRRNALDAASIFTWEPVSDRSEQAPPSLVYAALAGSVLSLRHLRGPGDDHLRVLDECQALWEAPGIAASAPVGESASGRPGSVYGSAISGSVAPGRIAPLQWRSPETPLFVLEMLLCSFAPICLLLIPKVRKDADGLY